jgi:predicted O-methyltransferase YrrM
MEDYLVKLFSAQVPERIKQARQHADRFGKGHISLGDLEAQLMATLIKTHGAKKFVEIGTLTGASALWILQALGEGGELWTFEKDPEHAKAAAEILEGIKGVEGTMAARVQVVVGDAVETLPGIEKFGPFDGIFIDGNKAAYGQYLDWAEKNVKKGGLILADNVFLRGSVFAGAPPSETFSKKQVEVMRNFNQRLADPNKFAGSIVPTSEGLYIATKLT